MTPTPSTLQLEQVSLTSAHRAPFHVLAVGKGRAVRPLLDRIARAGPPMQVHVGKPDGAGVCALRGQALDLIFVDADSAGYPAAQLCHVFKHTLETQAVPLIVVSVSERACELAVAQGADDFATPQTQPALLLKRIEALVYVRQARELLSIEASLLPLARTERGGLDEFLPRVQLEAGKVACQAAVVLFADLRGYTRMCECLAPAQVAVLLQEYFSLITQITYEYRGVVFSTAGDSLMAGFDLSQAPGESADRALQAAQMMLTRFALLAESWMLRFQVTAGLGVGLNTGEVARAAMGLIVFPQCTLIGDTVNVAARLCQRARAGEIVLSGAFKQSLDDHGGALSIVSLAQVTLRGRTQAVDVFCLPLEERHAPHELDSGLADQGQQRLGFDVLQEIRIAG